MALQMRFISLINYIQFVLGDNVEQCRQALTTEQGDSLHLIERINMDFQISNSIVPSALNLARMKISGQLPTLQVNFSDSKYKTLMRLIDVCIPKLDDEPEAPQRPPPRPIQAVSGSNAFRLRSGIFGNTEEYHFEDDDTDAGKDAEKEAELNKSSDNKY